ncbi:MAG TPA: hypothetical protein VJA82_13390 [Sediminibacterium sp.]|nr:hypothetical protein [Sediminibacterium sp.]
MGVQHLNAQQLAVPEKKPDPVGSYIDFYGDKVHTPSMNDLQVLIGQPLTHTAIEQFYSSLSLLPFGNLVENLLAFKKEKQLDDWLFYQLIRTAAESISPKKENYHRYTLYKWFLLNQTGYSAVTRLRNDTLLLYVQSNENVYDIPSMLYDQEQYICLNYHDYGSKIDFKQGRFQDIKVVTQNIATKGFSYKINRMPDFNPESYEVKPIQFAYGQRNYEFKVKVNKSINKLFNNYPSVEYAMQFTAPLSNATYQSLIPALKQTVAKMNQKKGVDYLMHLTRSSFAFENDASLYGKDKRFSPEQTLFSEYSDCEDRAAFFFYLVKEIYNLPMIVLSYPQHVTVAIQFDSPQGNPIVYKGNQYSVCEPTPQFKNLKIGQGIPSLKKEAFEVVYEYQPSYR